jgi:hypothetical protein
MRVEVCYLRVMRSYAMSSDRIVIESTGVTTCTMVHIEQASHVFLCMIMSFLET